MKNILYCLNEYAKMHILKGQRFKGIQRIIVIEDMADYRPDYYFQFETNYGCNQPRLEELMANLKSFALSCFGAKFIYTTEDENFHITFYIQEGNVQIIRFRDFETEKMIEEQTANALENGETLDVITEEGKKFIQFIKNHPFSKFRAMEKNNEVR